MSAGVVAAIVIGCGLAVAVATIAVRAALARAIVARIDHAAERLAGTPAEGPVESGVVASLDRLDRAIEAAASTTQADVAARARLEQALEVISPGILIADETGEVVVRNEVAESFESARHADALVEAAVTELIAQAVGGVGESRTLDLFGPPRRTVVITATPLPSPTGNGALAVIDDVSERRHLEAVRRDFVANISHELKTPVGALGLLAETLAAEDDAEVTRRLANRIHTEAFRVARTIEDLLELSRIESGELPERERVPVGQVVADAVERIRPAAEHAGTEIRVLEPNPRLAVVGDRRQLVSAVYNLLDNAVKYSDPGSPVEVRATTDGRRVDVVVEDWGIGIPARDIERVFERFYRVDPGRSRQTGGTGLGLAIVRHVVGNHDGEARVESRLGEGSTFTLSLPTASGPVGLSLQEETA